MGETKRVPEHEIGILDVVAASDPRADTVCASVRLVGVLSAGVELAIFVRSDVDVVFPELGALR